MSTYRQARIFSIPAGTPFLTTLVDALLEGRLVEGFRAADADPARLSDATIYLPTRRSARVLRSIFVERLGGRAAILPTIRPLGDFDEDATFFESNEAALDIAPPVGSIQRVLALAPLVRAWKRRLPGHIAGLVGDSVVVPASTADAIWLARDLAGLIDEVETEGGDWSRLPDLVSGDLAGWWQVTLEFLSIVTTIWPDALAEISRSNPGARRNLLMDVEAARLRRQPPRGPVIAAGSTGSIPATARLLAVIARLPEGAVVLPGLDNRLDERAWDLIGDGEAAPSAWGHPQFGLKKLLSTIGASRRDVEVLGAPDPVLASRALLLSEALRPAETTEAWADVAVEVTTALTAGALNDLALVEAANEREEALAIAIALREAAALPDAHVALVATDRNLARRVASELLRFGVTADDSGGRPLTQTQQGTLLALLLQNVFRPGDPATLLSLFKHPLFAPGIRRAEARRLAEYVELIVLRGGIGRPDIAALAAEFDARASADHVREPFWLRRITAADIDAARAMITATANAVAPLVALRATPQSDVASIARATVEALEALACDSETGFDRLYGDDAGHALADFLRELVADSSAVEFDADEWPDMMAALVAGRVVKPSIAADPRISIWGSLEARLQEVDLLVIGGLNEGSWPQRPEPDRFMSRLMKAGLALEPPERRVGQAAHDFMMAMGTRRLVLTRSARSGDAPSVASRWLQRLTTLAGDDAVAAMRARGSAYTDWARAIDAAPDVVFAARPQPAPPLALRPTRFSVTEIETLRRDPYAVYARRVLGLHPLESLLRDPGAAERGTLFHEILHRFTKAAIDAASPQGEAALVAIARECFDEDELPADVLAIWWPRFEAMAPHILAWEHERKSGLLKRHAEVRSQRVPVGLTGCELSGVADRIEARPSGLADILDYKTGYSPSKGQAHTLLSPQLALEGALLSRGGFSEVDARMPADLAYVRLRANGRVETESILEFGSSIRTAADLSEEAWQRLERLMAHYRLPGNGYLSRALPFRESDTDGDYDHLARVLEWSAGADGAGSEQGES